MAKKSRKRLARNEKDQSGCIKSLINNIFDFRQGRSSQKLLQDKKHESKRIAGAAYRDIKLESLSESCEMCKELNEDVQSETLTIAAGKMSVKELMDEEMIGAEGKKERTSNSIGETKENASGDGAHVQKNRRRTRSMASLNLRADDLKAAAGVSVSEIRSHRRHKSLSSIYLNVMVEELCSQINHKDGEELVTQLMEDPSIVEEKLWEATQVLISQFSDGKSVTKDGKIQASKELVDALRIIDSNKEVFLRLLQDPNSQLVKKIQTLQDVQAEEGKFKVIMDSHLLEEGTIGNGKQQSFFWRRFKGLERNPSKKNDSSEDLNRIVVLKPGPPVSGNSLPESPRSMGEKIQSNRLSSTFSFSEFKRKLKHVMRKEQNGAVENSVPHQPSSDKQQNNNLASRDRRVGGETVAMASPSRDHFFIERLPKSPHGVKKVDKAGKPKHDVDNNTNISPEQRVSNIYIEAKKHLAEFIGNSNEDEDSPRRQVPRSLGGLMLFSGFSSPTLCSLGKEGELIFSSSRECQTDEGTCQVKQETDKIHPQAPMKQESGIEPSIATTNEPTCEVDILPMEHISDGVPACQSNVDKPIHEFEVPACEDIVRSPNGESQAENKPTESTSLQVDSPSSSKCSGENWHSAGLRQDSCSESEPSSSSPIASDLTCSVTEKSKNRELSSDATSKPSPISVLDPLSSEDDISPHGIKSLFSAGELVQPRQIQFEEEISAASEQYASNRTCIEDEKHTFDFVKAVVQMSGLTWDELHRRTLLSDHLIDPSLLDEVDIFPDLLPCDFNLLFDLINDIVIAISWLNFGSMIPFTKPSVHSKLRDKDIFTEIWKGVDWYLKLDEDLDQIISKDLDKSGLWMNIRPDSETIGIQLQEAILEELVEDAILSCDFPQL